MMIYEKSVFSGNKNYNKNKPNKQHTFKSEAGYIIQQLIFLHFASHAGSLQKGGMSKTLPL